MRPIKEKKKVIDPWTFETCPWPLSLKHQSFGDCFTFSTKRKNCVMCNGIQYDFRELLDNFKQLDGSPCGIVKEVDA
jgi:hypothetical protein